MTATSEGEFYRVRSPALRCLWVGVVSLILALVNGFAGMARKNVCLPQASHCSDDFIQNSLIVLYFGSLVVLGA